MTSNCGIMKMYLGLERRLPVGAIPLAVGDSGGLVCLFPGGVWRLWLGGTLSSLPPDPQKDAMASAMEELGLTSAGLAKILGVSERTVEAWRTKSRDLPAEHALKITRMILDEDEDEDIIK